MKRLPSVQYPAFKALLTKVGVWVSPKMVYNLNGMLNYLSVGRWFKDKDLKIPFQSSDRDEFYRHVANQVSQPVTYLEFGVFEGETLDFWRRLLQHPDSHFHGFDSFEGLPETWSLLYNKGDFSTGGKIPQIDDPRVRFHKGWFEKTLPGFCKTLKPADQLLIHLDADLYSSTIYVLSQLQPFIRPGTVLIFDEFFERNHELRAFTEFLEEQKLTVECLGTTQAHVQAAFRILAGPS